MSGEPNLLKNVFVALGILILVVFVLVGYESYTKRQHVSSNDVSQGAAEPAGGAERDGRAESGTPFPATSGAAGTQAGQPEITAGGASSAGGMVPPAADSIQAQPPNGMTFGGSGHYQLYRQGNLTWRLNTDNGQTCIVFATESEWRKPQVARAGCRGR